MTLQTRRQAEKEKHKKNEKRKDSTGSTVEKEGKRQKLNKDVNTSSTENSSVSVSKKENSKKGRGAAAAAVDEAVKKEEEIIKENNTIENGLDQGVLTFNEDEKVLCFHGPLIYEAKVNYFFIYIQKNNLLLLHKLKDHKNIKLFHLH